MGFHSYLFKVWLVVLQNDADNRFIAGVLDPLW
jgi:hypothetical protein